MRYKPIRSSLVFPIVGRAKIQLWDTPSKNNLVETPTNWTVATMRPVVYGGRSPGRCGASGDNREGADLTQWCSRVNGYLHADRDSGTDESHGQRRKNVSPGITNEPPLGWVIESGAGQDSDAFTETVSAQWNLVRGKLRFIQNAKNVNNLSGGWGPFSALSPLLHTLLISTRRMPAKHWSILWL